MDDFQQKLNNLPKEIREYLTSMKAAELNVFICKKYKLKGDSVNKHTDLISSLFFKEIGISELVDKIKELFGSEGAGAKEMARDVAGIRLLIIKDWLGEDIEKYIRDLGGEPKDYYRYIDEQKKALVEEKKYFEEQFLEEKPFVTVIKKERMKEKEFDAKREKEDNLALFKEGLLGLLASKGEYLDDYNLALIKLLLDEGPEFKDRLEKALFANEEKLTSKEFFLEGKQKKPTVANWFKFFIKEQGSGTFDNIALTNFLMTSKNTKILPREEKRIVGKLLLLYRNLKFFPESMPDKTGRNWGIIPTGIKKEAEGKARKIGPPKQLTEEEKRDYMEKKEKEEKAQKRLDELELSLGKYSEGSLERKVVEEEIERLKNKS